MSAATGVELGGSLTVFFVLTDPMETPKPPRAKRRRTDSMLSTGSIGPIDFGYGTSPGFKH